MKSICKGVCDVLKPTSTKVTVSRYDQGQKYCTTCCEYVVTESVRCKCCNYVLRVKSHTHKHNKNEMKVSLH